MLAPYNLLEEVDLSENPKLNYLDLGYNGISSIDFSKNSELTHIYMRGNKLETVDVSNNLKLTYLILDSNQLETVDVSALENLEVLNVSKNKLRRLDVSNNTSLIELYCYNNQLSGSLLLNNNMFLKVLKCYLNDDITTIEFNCPFLRTLDIRSTGCVNLDYSQFPSLQTLYLSNRETQDLDLTKNINLENLYVNGYISDGAIDLSNCKKLKYFTFMFGYNVESIILPKNTLTKIDIQHTYLSELDLSEQSELETLVCARNFLTSLDLSECPNLRLVAAESNEFDTLDLSSSPLGALKYETQEDERAHILVNNTDFQDMPKLEYGYFINSYNNGYSVNCSAGIVVSNDVNIIFKPTPTVAPTAVPSVTPSKTPTSAPTSAPNGKPTSTPVDKPVVTNAPSATSTPGTTTSPKPTTAPSVTSAPTATNTPATSTPKPSKPQTDVEEKTGKVEDFAERLYTTCLGRDAEKEGKDYWTSELKSGKTGAEVAEGFFFSPEYEGRKLNNKEFIGTLYETFMGRTPADDEVAYWSSEMDNGKTRKDIFDGFVNSPEWANICLTYGILSGGSAKPTFEKEASPAVKAFAERLYTTCLGREAEKEGLEWWAAELANLRQTGTVAASGFFNSPEFIGLRTDDNEYVTRLYKTFMGRDPEKAGFEFWTSELKSGKDRQYVFDGFSVAPEFANLCADTGIMR